MRRSYDAIVVGSGPNGLSAAIRVAQAGLSVLLVEGRPTIGGGLRTQELTLPGFRHDACAAVHPLAAASPFFKTLPLTEHGLEWIFPPAALGHPFDDGEAVLVKHSVSDTASQLGGDADAYARLMLPLVKNSDRLFEELLRPLHFPRNPFLLARFGVHGLLSATTVAKRHFRESAARALFAGMAAHSTLPLERAASAAFGLVLSVVAHVVGWPFVKGGSQRLAEALASHLRSLDGDIRAGWPIQDIDELPRAGAYLFAVAPKDLVRIAKDRLPVGYRQKLLRYRHGPGVCKVDFALAGPIPWRNPALREAGTLHLGGSLEAIAASERAPWKESVADRPFLIVAQPSLFDESRAPSGKHTAWAYAHVPNGSAADVSERVEAQIERFAPGFSDLILAKRTRTATAMEAYNPNYVGGDINCGVQDLGQMWARPILSPNPYATPSKDIFLCSSATPPGGGVHGMCGFHAANAAIRRLGRLG